MKLAFTHSQTYSQTCSMFTVYDYFQENLKPEPRLSQGKLLQPLPTIK